MRISDWSSDVCSSDLASLEVLPMFGSFEVSIVYKTFLIDGTQQLEQLIVVRRAVSAWRSSHEWDVIGSRNAIEHSFARAATGGAIDFDEKTVAKFRDRFLDPGVRSCLVFVDHCNQR